MKLSVVLAAFNGERFIEEQLRSIATQTRRPDEIVVADDASTDATVDIVERVCAQEHLRLRLHRGSDRLGVVANFERAISSATGDVIALCDQDDRWCPDKLAQIEAAFASSPAPTGVFSNGWIVDQEGRRTGRTLWDAFGFDKTERRARGDDHLLQPLLRRNVATGATLAFVTSTRDLLLPIDPRGLHDVWIAVLLAATGGLRALPELLVDYRLHDANAVGLGERAPSRAVRARRSGGQVDELKQYEALVTRLRDRSPQHGANIELVAQKVAHLRLRCGLPRSPFRRALRIGSSLPAYARYSSGWRSPILDLVAPTRRDGST